MKGAASPGTEATSTCRLSPFSKGLTWLTDECYVSRYLLVATVTTVGIGELKVPFLFRGRRNELAQTFKSILIWKKGKTEDIIINDDDVKKRGTNASARTQQGAVTSSRPA